ncbi:pullulanase-type alpha-1,6-glucosidase [Vibrio coralliirubri]|uniref:pullulanase-type alpha-1,6-glucosidase n=1 Tax=Vibrio coralliirubri TaxID=1516159 RepID=UPI000633D651|nr:pullulanase-type alpha-1,6-glucosidase [Vibrio coralliirubri]CDT11600.1 Putative pullulanase precursor [Vibrio coralliirubri]CDT75728.1 Putative pullulanase precursor [Vibrio coralliirubri]
MNTKTFKLSTLTKAMLPILTATLIVGCNDDDDSSYTTPTPGTSVPGEVVLTPSVDLPSAAPQPTADQVSISYIADTTSTISRMANTTTDFSQWTLVCGDNSFPATSSDQFGPMWLVAADEATGSCKITDGTVDQASITLNAADAGASVGVTHEGTKVSGSRQDTLLTSYGLDQAGTDVKLPEATPPGELPTPPSGHFAIHLYDPLGDKKEEGADKDGYGNLNLHIWNNATCAAGDPSYFNDGWDDVTVTPDASDEFGPVWYVPVIDDPSQCFNLIFRNANKDKLIGADLVIDISGQEANPAVTYMAGSATAYATRGEAFEVAGPSSEFTIDSVGAILIDDSTLVWQAGNGADLVQLMFSANGDYTVSEEGVVSGASIKLTSTALSDEQKAKFPHLADYPTFELPQLPTDLSLASIMKGSLIAIASSYDADSEPAQLRSSTAVQYAGALDAIFAEAATEQEYGPIYGDDGVTFRLWAPTASEVELVVYNSDKSEAARHPMVENNETGSWSIEVETDTVDGKYYRYAMKVFQPREQKGFSYEVTDPYSVSLSTNSFYSQAIDLDSDELKPAGWDSLEAPHSQDPENGDLANMVIYESHVRDFSARDSSTDNKGKYLAFTEQNSVPVNHLKELSDAGISHLHLMPVFDIATINEDPDQVADIDEPFSKLCSLNESIKNDSRYSDYCTSGGTIAEAFEELKATDTKDNAVVEGLNEYVRSVDSYNWGYDPFHYTVPEGSYATDAEGTTRILEFREMVKSVKQDVGMNVVVDVVYNHTNASGMNDKSVLDKVVPLYYQRLVPDSGMVETSTCCENTAPEHAMFAKLIDDSIQTWVEAYKIDAFRWDLMGHHPLSQMQQTLAAAREVNPEVYFYGEGWNFGEVENNKRFVQATQPNLGGTGIGSFSDRLRDAVRGGSPFDGGDALRETQGFATGAATLPNELMIDEEGNVSEIELERALHQIDLTRLGMAGNLKDFKMVDFEGNTQVGSSIDYNGQEAGYAEQPWEVQNYVSKHDNQTFWDINMYKVSEDASVDVRVQMQTIGMSTVLLGQAMPFNHMGGELLRSKSMQRDSYDYGDWYNLVDFTLTDSNWNKGLPAKDKDADNYDQIARATADLNSQPEAEHVERMYNNYKELLMLRSASDLMTLPSAQEIINRVDFRNTGKGQATGVIAMTIDNGSTQTADIDSSVDAVVVIINATPETQTVGDFVDHESKPIVLSGFELSAAHEDNGIAGNSSFTEGKFSVPAWSTAVFVQLRGSERSLGLPVAEKKADLPPFGKTKVYIAGGFEQASWDPAAIEVPYTNSGLYTIELGLASDTGYKFTHGDWDSQISCGGENCPSNFTEMGMYEFSLDASDVENPVIVDAELGESYKDKTWYIPGSISGNWGHDDAQKMTTNAQDATMVSFTTAELAANQEFQFKFTCGDWGQCEHGYSDVVVAESSLAVTDNGGNLAFTPASEGTYTVTFDIISKQVNIAATK